jgi:hypothetical protein
MQPGRRIHLGEALVIVQVALSTIIFTAWGGRIPSHSTCVAKTIQSTKPNQPALGCARVRLEIDKRALCAVGVHR